MTEETLDIGPDTAALFGISQAPVYKCPSKTLAHALIEEHSSNGGHFSSPDTEIWLRELRNDSETIPEALKRVAGITRKQT